MKKIMLEAVTYKIIIKKHRVKKTNPAFLLSATAHIMCSMRRTAGSLLTLLKSELVESRVK